MFVCVNYVESYALTFFDITYSYHQQTSLSRGDWVLLLEYILEMFVMCVLWAVLGVTYITSRPKQ